MVSLTIAPLFKNKGDWDQWYFGLIPFGIFVCVTCALMYFQILTWKDPISAIQSTLSEEDKSSSPVKEVEASVAAVAPVASSMAINL